MPRTPSIEPSKATNAPKINPYYLALFVIVLVAAVALATTNTWKSRGRSAQQKQLQQAQSDLDRLVSGVAKHIVIDRSTGPTVFDVEDPAMLMQQNPVFYKDVQKGDRLMIWNDKAVLYSPSRDIVLSVLPLQLAQAAQAPATTELAKPIEDVTIEVRNGSGISGKGKVTADALKAEGLNVLSNVGTSAKVDETLIVNVSGKPATQTLQKLASLVQGKIVSKLPEGEKAATGDIVVIIGKNAQ